MEKVIVDGRIYKVVVSGSGLCHGCSFQEYTDVRICDVANTQRENQSCAGTVYKPYEMADLVKEYEFNQGETK